MSRKRALSLIALLCLAVGCGESEDIGSELGAGTTLEPAEVIDENCSWRCEIETIAETDPRAALEKLMALTIENPEVSAECHNTSHDVGRIASINLGAEGAFSLGDLSCGSGYWHGVITQWVADGHEIRELAENCVESSVHSMGRWECGHGIGHAIVLAENLDRAISECGGFPDEIRDGCWHGALMQDYTDNPKRTPYGPCGDRGYDEEKARDYLHTCYSMEAVRIVKGPGTAPTLEELRGSIDRCREIKEAEWVKSCAAGVAGGVTDDSSPSREKIEAACYSKSGDSEVEDWCWMAAGSNMVANLGGLDPAEK